MSKWAEQVGELIKEGKSVAISMQLRASAMLIGPIIAHFAHDKERSHESWRVVLLSPHYGQTVEVFREILNNVPLPGDTVQRHAIHDKHGFIYCAYDEARAAYGVYAKHLLWVIESEKEEVWDTVVSRLLPGDVVLAFGWVPKRYWSLFANLKAQEETNAKTA